MLLTSSCYFSDRLNQSRHWFSYLCENVFKLHIEYFQTCLPIRVLLMGEECKLNKMIYCIVLRQGGESGSLVINPYIGHWVDHIITEF